jgi:heterotetrameric sarcosine oxidase delta subunit
MRITCPYCGERDRVEFVYGGDASHPFPDLGDTDIDNWTDFVFLRDNPKGDHAEYWQHQSGCRQWLRVVRHTVTHEISSVTPARDQSWSDNANKVKTA